MSGTGGAKKVLKEDALYFTDNGRIVCGKHAGMTAQYTGRDISGQRVKRVTKKDADAWLEDIGKPIRCEDCGPSQYRPLRDDRPLRDGADGEVKMTGVVSARRGCWTPWATVLCLACDYALEDKRKAEGTFVERRRGHVRAADPGADLGVVCQTILDWVREPAPQVAS